MANSPGQAFREVALAVFAAMGGAAGHGRRPVGGEPRRLARHPLVRSHPGPPGLGLGCGGGGVGGWCYSRSRAPCGGLARTWVAPSPTSQGCHVAAPALRSLPRELHPGRQTCGGAWAKPASMKGTPEAGGADPWAGVSLQGSRLASAVGHAAAPPSAASVDARFLRGGARRGAGRARSSQECPEHPGRGHEPRENAQCTLGQVARWGDLGAGPGTGQFVRTAAVVAVECRRLAMDRTPFPPDPGRHFDSRPVGQNHSAESGRFWLKARAPPLHLHCGLSPCTPGRGRSGQDRDGD